jgi:hypothetical protein
MTTSRLVLACVYVSFFGTVLHAQAALEYAARSAGSAFSSGGAGMHIGVCPLDGSFVPCFHQYYPAPFYIAIVGICFVLVVILRRNLE